jgi:RNA polymerase sigma-B factor
MSQPGAPAVSGTDRDQMVEQFLPLADRLARRYRHTAEPLDDLVQVARVGLVKAVDRWDPDRGHAFSTFAVPTITGELRRYFRDSTWTVKPPRSLQDLYLSAQRTREYLSQELGREPTARDVAERLGRTPEDIVDALEAGSAHSPASLDAAIHADDDDGIRLADLVNDPRSELARRENSVALSQLSAILDERDWEVVRLRFEEDLVQREIAERVGCSQMHVSRIVRDALAHLRTAAAASGAVFD